MNQTSPPDQEMTDVFNRFKDPLPPMPQPGDDKIKINDRKRAALATAAVLLGGGAAFAAVNYDNIVEAIKEVVDPVVPITGGGESPTENTDETVDDVPPAPVAHNQASSVQSGTITPSESIDIASTVSQEMTFGEAFAAAREEVGTGGIFSWHGEVYNTYYVEEWQGLSLGQRQEFLAEVGYTPTAQGASQSTDEPDLYEFTIDGRLAIGIDDDHDGVADAVVFLDEETNDIVAYMDMGGDDRIDSVYRFDPLTDQVVGMQVIEEPFLVDVNRFEDLSTSYSEPAVADTSFAVNDEKTLDGDYLDDDDYSTESGYVNDVEMPEMD